MVAESERNPAQWAVLGSMLIDETVVGEVLSRVEDSDFTTPRCRLVFQAIRAAFTDGARVDPVEVLHRLGEREAWSGFLMELMDRTPTAANVWEYVRILREQARVYQANLLGERLLQTNDPEELAGLAAELNALGNRRMRGYAVKKQQLQRRNTQDIEHLWL